MGRFGVIVLVLLYLGVCGVQCLRFDLPSGQTKCIAEEIQNNVMVLGNYHVVEPGSDEHHYGTANAHPVPDSHKVTARVTSPYGNSMHYADKVESGQFTFTTSEAGDYLACFWIPPATPSTKATIDIEWKTGVFAKAPASFVNSGNSSTVPSPAGFLSLSSMFGTTCSPGRPISTMFATGPYAHETQLVSPPVFSTVTTEPSTAPFTPPPELAQLSNPASPEVPFAHLLESSSNTKVTGQENGLTFSSFPFISSGYGTTNDLLSAYQLYPGSPAGSFLSPRSGSSSPFPDVEFPAQWKVFRSAQGSILPRNEHSNLFNYDMATSGTSMFSQDSDAFCSATSAGFHLDHVRQQCQSFGDQSKMEPFIKREAVVCCNGENMEQERHKETNKYCISATHRSSKDIRVKFPMESSQMEMEQELNRATFELVTKASARPSEILADSLPISSTEIQNSYVGESSTSSTRCIGNDIQLAFSVD